MFEGNAAEAIEFYQNVFPAMETANEVLYGDDAGEMAGKIQTVDVKIAKQEFIFIDSPAKHDFTFTASISLFVTCDSAEEVESVYDQLAEGGRILMPLGVYPFAKKFAWVSDRFGVSWQLIF